MRKGGIVAFPTETVYGLGANAFDPEAVSRIFEAKGRPGDNPLIVHIAELAQIDELASSVSDDARRLIHAFFPGPLTLVFQRSEKVPPSVTAELDTVGVRMPDHPMATEFLRECGVPVAAPSANLSGRPSPTTWQAVLEDLDGRIDCILEGEATDIGLESTVVDCSEDVPRLLRQGAISIERLREVVPEIVDRAGAEDAAPRSPGLKHRHYSPHAKVVIIENGLVENTENAGFIGLRMPLDLDGFGYLRICSSVEDYAKSLFEFFRECDRRGLATIYCEPVAETGIGAALADRLRRAAQG